jgi:hypothetical protein
VARGSAWLNLAARSWLRQVDRQPSNKDPVVVSEKGGSWRREVERGAGCHLGRRVEARELVFGHVVSIDE